MSSASPIGAPQPAIGRDYSGVARWRGFTATTALTVYLVLLLAVPSNVTIAALGAYGRPSLLWGLFLLAWWLLSRIQYRVVDVRPVAQPIRHAFGLLLVIALVSFAAAMMRGQPVDQVSPAITALVRMASWAGVMLVAMDGVRTITEITTLARRLAIAAGLLAGLGLLQSVTHQTFLDWFGMIPGLTYGGEGIGARGEFARATGTAIHPLEFAVSLIGLLPIAFAAAVTAGFRHDEKPHRVRWWIPAVLIMITSLVAVSRSAIIGLVIAVIASMSFLPVKQRWVVAGLGFVALVAIAVLVPGMITTMLYLFIGASDDPSTQSRADALARVPEFLASSPVYGVGFGTFLPRYYIFDNQIVLLLIELGIAGVIAFAALVIAALWSTLWAGHVSPQPDTKRLSRMFGASLVSIVVLFVFFDALSFPIAAGIFFLIVGLCGSMRTIGAVDARLAAAAVGRQTLDEPEDGVASASDVGTEAPVEAEQVASQTVERIAGEDRL
ncbi:O-antigen ligase family protein [Microbacterium ureisolvens]|uniref:O-antigen ligase family protein n=1 Tax=Microbacterium ureisolvens TaxID=2781186 RepID=UPI00362629F1